MKLPTPNAAAAVTLLVTGLAGTPACMSMQTPARSGLLAQTENVVVDPRQVTTQVNELTARWLRTVEWRADEIRSTSNDATVRRNALLWKINGSSAMLRATSHGDPLIALLDAWTLVFQFRDYFATGRGAAMFGDHVAIARDSTDVAVKELEQVAGRLATPQGVERARAIARDFATREPIANDYFLRSSVAGELVATLDAESRDAFAALGAITQTVETLSPRLVFYLDYLPRLARWQAELVLEDLAVDAKLTGVLEDVSSLDRTAARIAATLDRTVDSRLDEMLTRALTQVGAELDDVERLVNAQRELVLEGLPKEYEAIFTRVTEQRLAALDEVDATIDEALDRIDKVADRSLGGAGVLSRETVDYAFERATPLVIGAFIGVLVLLVVYRLVPKRVRQT